MQYVPAARFAVRPTQRSALIHDEMCQMMVVVERWCRRVADAAASSR
jgi:hypothetical protein